MSETITVQFGYSALQPSLEEQANKQGLTLGDKAEHLETLRKARTHLMFHVLTDKQTSDITAKIHKLVMKSLKPIKEERQ